MSKLAVIPESSVVLFHPASPSPLRAKIIPALGEVGRAAQTGCHTSSILGTKATGTEKILNLVNIVILS